MTNRHLLFMSAVSLLPLTVSACSSNGSEAPPNEEGDASEEVSPSDAGEELDASAVEEGDASSDGSTEAADAGEEGEEAIDASSDVEEGGVVPADAADAEVDAADAAGDAAEEAEAGVPLGHVRLAHFAPDAPAIDFCLRSSGAGATSPFVFGPFLKGRGGTTGLAYGQVTEDLPVGAGAYDLRLVAPNAADCSVALDGATDTTLPALPTGGYLTLAAIGNLGTDAGITDGGTGFQVKAYVDDRAVTAGQTKVRFIHDAPGAPPFDVGFTTGESFTPVWTSVAFPEVGTGTGVDANGYFTTGLIAGQTLVVRPTGTSADALTAPGFTSAANSVTSLFLIGVNGSSTAPLQLLACSDLDTAAPLSACAPLQ